MFFSFLIVRLLDFWTARRKDGFPLETREARTRCPETLSNTALFFSLQIYQVKANETRPNLTCKCQNLFYAMLISVYLVVWNVVSKDMEGRNKHLIKENKQQNAAPPKKKTNWSSHPKLITNNFSSNLLKLYQVPEKLSTNQHEFCFQGRLQYFVKADLTSVAPWVVLALLWVACPEKVPG